MDYVKRAWIATAVAVLALGIAGALGGLMPSDTGLTPIWYILVGLLAFPLGLIGSVLFSLGLAWVESKLLGPETHFSMVAYVCWVWSIVVGCGLLQGSIARAVLSRTRTIREGSRDAT
jgi:hypothetical protein